MRCYFPTTIYVTVDIFAKTHKTQTYPFRDLEINNNVFYKIFGFEGLTCFTCSESIKEYFANLASDSRELSLWTSLGTHVLAYIDNKDRLSAIVQQESDRMDWRQWHINYKMFTPNAQSNLTFMFK